jgi:hypothetical protein
MVHVVRYSVVKVDIVRIVMDDIEMSQSIWFGHVKGMSVNT